MTIAKEVLTLFNTGASMTLSHLRNIFTPFLLWLPLVDRNGLRADLIAGITGAVIVLPQGVGIQGDPAFVADPVEPVQCFQEFVEMDTPCEHVVVFHSVVVVQMKVKQQRYFSIRTHGQL